MVDLDGVGDDKERITKTEGYTVAILLQHEGTIDRTKRSNTVLFRRDLSNIALTQELEKMRTNNTSK